MSQKTHDSLAYFNLRRTSQTTYDSVVYCSLRRTSQTTYDSLAYCSLRHTSQRTYDSLAYCSLRHKRHTKGILAAGHIYHGSYDVRDTSALKFRVNYKAKISVNSIAGRMTAL